jgi:hypothetical protein
LDKSLAPKLVMFYHPLRASKSVAYEGVNKVDGKFLGLSGVKQITPNRMSFLGGVCSLLPIVEKIGEANENQGFLLLEWLKLLLICLKDRPENQREACGMKLFKALSQVLLNIPSISLSEQTVEVLEDLINSVIPELRDQITVYLLWCLELWKRTPHITHIKLLKLLKLVYSRAPKALSKALGVGRILDLLIEHYDIRELVSPEEEGRYNEYIELITQILEVVLLTGGEGAVKDLSQIVNALFNKPNRILQTNLLQLTKKLMTERPGDVVAAAPSVFAKTFVENNGVELLLYLISCSSLEMRGLCLACLDRVLSFSQKIQNLGATKDIYSFVASEIIPKPQSQRTSKLSESRKSDIFSSMGLEDEDSIDSGSIRFPFKKQGPRLSLTQKNPLQRSMSDLSDKFRNLQVKESVAELKIDLPKEPEPKKPTSKFEFNFDEEEDIGIKPPPAPKNLSKFSGFEFPDEPKRTQSSFTKDFTPKSSDSDVELELPKRNRLKFPGSRASNKPEVPPAPRRKIPTLTFDIDEPGEEDTSPVILTLDEPPTPPQAVQRQVKSFSMLRKGVGKPLLEEKLLIDTDKINENFTCGGEKGVERFDTEEEAAFIRSVSDMASDCLKYMRGEKTVDTNTALFPLPPVAYRPQSVRGIKHIDFSATFKDEPEHSPIVEEASVDFSDEEPVQSNEDEISVYNTVLEMVLRRPLHGAIILDDSADFIQSSEGLKMLMDIAKVGSLHLKHKALQDLLMLTKWNSSNATILANVPQFHVWLLELLYKLPEDDDIGITINDMGNRLHTIVLKQALLVDDDGWKQVRRLLLWLELKRTESYQLARDLVTGLLERLLESIHSNIMGCRPSLNSTVWKNLVTSIFCVEELLLYFKYLPEEQDDAGVYNWRPDCLEIRGKTWKDSTLLDVCFMLLDPLWPSNMFEEREFGRLQPYVKLMQLINKSSTEFKTDIQLLLYDPPGDLKKRGSFIQIAIHLACLNLEICTSLEETRKWAGIIERIVMFILLVSEVGKKHLTASNSKNLASCLVYAISYCVRLFEQIKEPTKSDVIKNTTLSLLKCLFSVYLHVMKNNSIPKQSIGNFFKGGFIQTSHICIDAYTTIFENYSLFDLSDIEKFYRDSFDTLELYMQNSEFLERLFSGGSRVVDQFINKAKSKNIWNLREKSAEKMQKEALAQEKYLEEIKVKIHNQVLKIAADKSDEEDQKRISISVHNAERIRQRRHMWLRLKKVLCAWRGPWHTPFDFSLEPFQVMDWEYGRPLLKIRSESSAFYLQKKKIPELNENPTDYLSKIAQMNDLRRSESIAVEDEEDADLEEKDASVMLPPSRTLSKIQDESPLALVISRENSLIQVEVSWITPLTLKYGLLQVIEIKNVNKLRFVLDSRANRHFSSKVALFEYTPSPNKPYVKEWSLDGLKLVLPKTYVLRHTAAEFMFKDGRSILMNFASNDDRYRFVTMLKKLKKQVIPKIYFFSKNSPDRLLADLGITEKWMNWEISNFEYIMLLNFIASRSYHDLTQYPVFPWIFNKYSYESIDLNNPAIYRDFTKSMGAMGSYERTEFFRERFYNLDSSHTPAFHYGSHYSNPGIVLYYLTRLYPYSEGAKELQDGKFDLPDRLFHSIPESFASATEDLSDVRELIPEFFTLPEMLMNLEQFDFGRRQNNELVGDIRLPAWANNAHEFIRIHHEALESDIVSANLHEWINLIFGYKQRGPEAEANMNTFYYMTYEGNVDLDKITNEHLRASTEAQVVHFGKTPSQLFKKPHPPRLQRQRAKAGPIIVAREANIKIYLPVTRKSISKPQNSINFFQLSERALLKAKLFKDNRIFAVRNNGNLVSYRWWSTPVGESKAPFTCALEKERKLGKDLRTGSIETRDRSMIGFNAPIAILNNGRLLAHGGYWDGRLTIQKTNENESPSHLQNHYNTITCLVVDSTEKLAITGSKDGDCLVWHIDNDYWKARWHYIDHEDTITGACISNELGLFSTCSLDGSCNIYSLRKGRLMRVIRLPESTGINMVAFSTAAPCKVLLFSSEENTLYSYSVNGAFLHKTHERCYHICSPIVVKDHNQQDFLVYGTDIGEIVIRHAGNLQPMRRFWLSGSSPVLTLIATPDLRFLLAGCADGELTVLTDPESTLSVLERQWQFG